MKHVRENRTKWNTIKWHLETALPFCLPDVFICNQVLSNTIHLTSLILGVSLCWAMVIRSNGWIFDFLFEAIWSSNGRRVDSRGVCVSVSVYEGISAVCFGWGTARGRAAEGAETVRVSSQSTSSSWREPRQIHGEFVRQNDYIHTGNSELKGF